MPLGTEVGVGPGNIVLDGDPAPRHLKGHRPTIFGQCPLWPNGCMDQDATWYVGKPWHRRCFVRWGRSSPDKGHSPQFLVHVYCGQTAGWMKSPLIMEVGLGPGHIVLDGDPALPTKGAQQAPLFVAHVCCGHGHPSQLLLSSCILPL